MVLRSKRPWLSRMNAKITGFPWQKTWSLLLKSHVPATLPVRCMFRVKKTEYSYFALEFFDALLVFAQRGLTATAENGSALRGTGLSLTYPAVQEVRVQAEVSSDLAGVRAGLRGELDGLLFELGGEGAGSVCHVRLDSRARTACLQNRSNPEQIFTSANPPIANAS